MWSVFGLDWSWDGLLRVVLRCTAYVVKESVSVCRVLEVKVKVEINGLPF